MPNWRLRRNTRVIKSCRKWVLCGSTVACHQKEVNMLYNRDTHCNVRESQVHLGIQHGTYDHAHQCEAIPHKIPIKSSGETHRNIGKRMTKYACIVDADESTRPRVEGAGHKPHQDHITAKGTNFMTHCSLVHKFIPMPQAWKIPDAKAVEKQWWNLEKIPAWQLTNVRSKN